MLHLVYFTTNLQIPTKLLKVYTGCAKPRGTSRNQVTPSKTLNKKFYSPLREVQTNNNFSQMKLLPSTVHYFLIHPAAFPSTKGISTIIINILSTSYTYLFSYLHSLPQVYMLIRRCARKILPFPACQQAFRATMKAPVARARNAAGNIRLDQGRTSGPFPRRVAGRYGACNCGTVAAARGNTDAPV